MSRASRGLTLIELLVTMGVLGLLAALVVPAVQQSRRSAWQMECANQLRQIGTAMDLYLDARGGQAVYPDAAMFPGLPPGKPSIYDVLAPYCENNRQLFVCPDDHDFADSIGLSYQYEAISLAGKPRMRALRNNQGERLSSHRVWIASDLSNFHGPLGEDGSRNFLYVDGHVDAKADGAP